MPEPWGIWSDGKEAFLQFVLPSSFAAAAGPVVLRVEATAYAPARPSQDVQVYAGDRLLATWPVRAGHWAEYVVPLPTGGPEANEAITLRLAIPGAISPAEAQGTARDPRRLGIGLRRIGLAHPE